MSHQPAPRKILFLVGEYDGMRPNKFWAMSLGCGTPGMTLNQGFAMVAEANCHIEGDRATHGASNEGNPQSGDRFQGLKDRPVAFYSWHGTRLSSLLTAHEVPMPGVVIALFDAPGAVGIWEADPHQAVAMALFVRDGLELLRGDEIRAFTLGPYGTVEPIVVAHPLVFVSYSTPDSAMAGEMVERIQAAGVDTFMATLSIKAGVIWESSIREALAKCTAALILITPNSRGSPWVMMEVGALWALGKPFVPASMYVAPTELPEVLTERQVVDLTTVKEREACTRRVVELARGVQ